VCLRSNILTNVVSSLKDHPIFAFIENDVPVVLCTDSPGVHAFNLSEEYLQFHDLARRADILESMFTRQKKYAFGTP
jgi:adenosine deaminase